MVVFKIFNVISNSKQNYTNKRKNNYTKIPPDVKQVTHKKKKTI